MWNLSSRIHTLNAFPKNGVSCFVKRDDELGCGISGSKLRKYSSLIPYLLQKGIKHLIIIAGCQSNNLLAALQLAREFQFSVTLMLIQPRNNLVQGNFKLSQLFLREEEVVWISREQWSKVHEIAENYLKDSLQPGFILHEGASVHEAMPGAMTLASDVLRNEKQYDLNFQHIFVDAGTGFSALGLIKGLTEVDHPALIHVLLLADDAQTFKHKLNYWLGDLSGNYQCIIPSTARSFGSVNQQIKSEIKRMALEEGILADPIYSAKLFYESRRHIAQYNLKGNVLIIHSGGTLTMAGFTY